MTTYNPGEKVNSDIIQPGFEFVGGNGITYTVTERERIRFDDMANPATYLTVTDGTNEYTLGLWELVGMRAA
jgi:hypothetical protein